MSPHDTPGRIALRPRAAAALLAALSTSPAGTAAAPQPATHIERDPHPPNPGIPCWTVRSPFQKGPVSLEIVTPDHPEPGRAHPVVILLPVNTGTRGNWGSAVVEAKRLNLHNAFGAILVAPAFDTEPWGGDHPTDPRVRQQSYILETILPFVLREFPADPARVHLVGFSKSGLGALSLFLRHTDRFANVAVFDPFGRVDSQQIYDAWGLAASYGPRENFDRFDPFVLVPQKKEALREGRRVTLLAGGPGPRRGVDNLRDLFADHGCSFTYAVLSDAGHDWRTGWLPTAFASILPIPGAAR